MARKMRLLDVLEGKQYGKAILKTSILLFIVLELLIYLFSVIQAGDFSHVVITDAHGNVIYETTGGVLTGYEKRVFENTYGPLKDYTIAFQTEHLPFPFRGWLTAAVGLPIGLILLIVFIVRVYLALMYGEEERAGTDRGKDAEFWQPGSAKLASVFYSFDNISIFHIGVLAMVAVLLVWLIPNLLGDFAGAGIKFITDFKWFFLGLFLFLAGLIVWVVYLRYRLSRVMLEKQVEVEKMRIRREPLTASEPPPPMLAHNPRIDEGADTSSAER